MFLLHEYDIFWAFLMISSVIPILAFLVFGVLAPISQGPEKVSSYESGMKPMGDAWIQYLSLFEYFSILILLF
ncbi:hypothetical protein AMTRI_Chr06g172990 [Amborella trichopoda]